MHSHVVLIQELVSHELVALLEITLFDDGISYCPGIYFPSLFAFVSVCFEQILIGSEVW